MHWLELLVFIVLRKTVKKLFDLTKEHFKHQPHKMVKHTLKQFFGKLPTNFLRVFDHFVGLALKKLKMKIKIHKVIKSI